MKTFDLGRGRRIVLHAIGKLRVAAWSNNITVGSVPNDEWIDEFDPASRHFGIFDGDKLIAAARFSVHDSIAEVPESEVYHGVFHSTLKTPIASLNRLVTHPDYRGLGCSFYLDRVRLEKAKEMGCTCVIGHASEDRLEQLERFGFLIVGRANDYSPGHFLLNAGPAFVLHRTLIDLPTHPRPPTGGGGGRSDLVSLLRGAFACPLIQSISELEITDRILSSPFSLRDFDFLQDSEAVSATLDYLCSLGLIERSESELLQTTEIGRYVLERAGAFGLINSYRDYFADYKSTLTTSRLATRVQRLENVQSTGDLHGRKYFPWAIRSIEPQKPQCLVDLGCGNGNYLSKAISATKSNRVIAVDISPIAVESAIANLSTSDVEIQGVVCSANDVDQWSKAVPNSGDAAVISAWFVLHEFCHGGAEVIREFLERVHRHCPLAELIIGEIIAIPSNLLSKVRETSIYPEVQLFHRLSGQSLLTWQEHQKWIAEVPYRLEASDLHDAIVVDGYELPSTVVWHLVPA